MAKGEVHLTPDYMKETNNITDNTADLNSPVDNSSFMQDETHPTPYSSKPNVKKPPVLPEGF